MYTTNCTLNIECDTVESTSLAVTFDFSKTYYL